jgi:arylsulfatase A-like enzyme
MHSMNDSFDYLAPLPLLPVVSVLAILVGLILILTRSMPRLIARWLGPVTIWKTPRQSAREPHSDGPLGDKSGPGSRYKAGRPFLTILGFGLLAGWIELGFVVLQRTINPHVSLDSLRTNRHFVWMIPVADVLIFAVVGLAVAVLARFRPGLARRIAWRLGVGLLFLTVLLTVEGLFTVAAVSLSCGLASMGAPWLESRATYGSRRFVRAGFVALAAGLVALTATAYKHVISAEEHALASRPPAKPGAPNVLLIVLDTVRAASLSLYGHNRPTTPNLERLARRGIVFSEARSTAPWTLPSHASMLTGRWPHELSVSWDLPLDGTFPTLAEVLEREGYATAGFVGNVFYCNSLYGLARGFAHYEDAYENQTVSLFETVWSSGVGRRIIQALGYPIRLDAGPTSIRKTAAMLNRDVTDWLARRPADRPFFAFINYYDAHCPRVLHEDLRERFGMAALPLDEQLAIKKRFLSLAGKPVPGDMEHERIVSEGFQRCHDLYDTSIAYLDRQVGVLIDEIERRGLLENTLVIVTSDHGEQIGEHGVIAHGASLYRQEVHVPLVVIPPLRSSTNKIVNEPVSLRDIPSTIAEWVNLGSRNPFPGASLTRFLHDASEVVPGSLPVLSEVQQNEVLPRQAQIPSSLGPVVSLVSRDRTYIRGGDGREELYDRLHDPLETVDLSGYPQSRAELDRFREELGSLRPDATTRAR